MTSGGHDLQADVPPLRPVLMAGALLLVLDLTFTAVVYGRLPETIAVHWTATGVADNGDSRVLAWFLPMSLAFVIGLALVARRRTTSREQVLLAAGAALACLYLFSASLLLLLANLGNRTWQEGSVGARWMLVVLTVPALVFLAGVLSHRRATSPGRPTA